jgi:hypothetical protein
VTRSKDQIGNTRNEIRNGKTKCPHKTLFFHEICHARLTASPNSKFTVPPQNLQSPI